MTHFVVQIFGGDEKSKSYCSQPASSRGMIMARSMVSSQAEERPSYTHSKVWGREATPWYATLRRHISYSANTVRATTWPHHFAVITHARCSAG
jgi:hypothetical protein